MAFSRLNASVAPDRFTTVSCMASTVVNRFSHSEHERRRRIEVPSSDTRLSSTRVSVWRQYGQCICGGILPVLERALIPVVLLRRSDSFGDPY